MPATLNVDAYSKKPKLAISLISDYLRDGSLALAVGAGASESLGLPGWRQLAERCLKETNHRKKTKHQETIPKGTDNKTIGLLIDIVEKEIGGSLNMGRSPEYRTLVKDCLYDGVRYDKTILQKELLIALGALMIGSTRGSVKEVINFNFDDVLDWYLALHGYDTQIITTLPELRREPDVTIYHPHGYLPKVGSYPQSDFLVFGQHSYDQIIGDRQNRALFESMMEHRVFLCVGLSGDDPTFGPALAEVQKKIQNKRYTAFWLFGPDIIDLQIINLQDRNVVPLCFKSFDEIPDFLLQICQTALKN